MEETTINKIQNKSKLFSAYTILGIIVYNSINSLSRFNNIPEEDKLRYIYNTIKQNITDKREEY